MARPKKCEFENGNIPAQWKKICLFEIEHPEMTQEEIAKACGTTRKTLYTLHHNEKYLAFFHKENEKVFRALESLAIQAMTKQARKGNIKAASYILNYLNYQPVDKVELQSNGVVEINLTGGEDGDPFALNGDED
jgi:DNA-binding XRE family transcriptional regulator